MPTQMRSVGLMFIAAGLAVGSRCGAADAGQAAAGSPESAVTAPSAAAVPAPATTPAAAAPPTVQLTGTLQTWALQSFARGSAGTFRINRMEINGAAALANGISFRLKIDPAAVKEDDLKRRSILQDAIGCWEIPVPVRAKAQFGQFKVPFGLEGLLASDRVDTVDRSMMTTKLGWTNLRDIGGMLDVKVGPAEIWAGAFNGEGLNRSDVNNHKNGNVRAVVRPVSWLGVGAAYQGGRQGTAMTLNEHTGLELDMSCNAPLPVHFYGEHGFGVLGPRGHAVESRTGYAALVAGLMPQVWEFVAKYDWLDANARKARDWQTEATVGFNWWWIAGKRTGLQANYVRVDEPTPKVKDDLIRANFQVSF